MGKEKERDGEGGRRVEKKGKRVRRKEAKKDGGQRQERENEHKRTEEVNYVRTHNVLKNKNK